MSAVRDRRKRIDMDSGVAPVVHIALCGALWWYTVFSSAAAHSDGLSGFEGVNG